MHRARPWERPTDQRTHAEVWLFAPRFALGSFLSLEPDEVAETPLLHAGKWKWWTNVLLYQRSVTTKDPRRRSKSCNGSVVVQITEVGLGVTMSEHCCWNTDLAEAKMRLKAKEGRGVRSRCVAAAQVCERLVSTARRRQRAL